METGRFKRANPDRHRGIPRQADRHADKQTTSRARQTDRFKRANPARQTGIPRQADKSTHKQT